MWHNLVLFVLLPCNYNSVFPPDISKSLTAINEWGHAGRKWDGGSTLREGLPVLLDFLCYGLGVYPGTLFAGMGVGRSFLMRVFQYMARRMPWKQ